MTSKHKNKRWMAIKIDLEKAYDKVRWDFVEASLRATSTPDFLMKVIMSAITIMTM